MRLTLRGTCAVLALAAITTSTPALAQRSRRTVDPAAMQRLQTATGGMARVEVDESSGTARFVALPRRSQVATTLQAPDRRTPRERSAAFLKEHGEVFGVRDADAQLRVADVRADRLGHTRVKHQQVHQGVPVFAGVLMSHFDQANELRAVNGKIVADIDVSPVPTVSEHAAAQTAAAKVNADNAPRIPSEAREPNLYIFREGLAKGVPGPDHLVWEVEVTNGTDVREFVYVSAHTGKIVDQITGIYDAMYRRAYDGVNLPTIPPSYPGSPFWEEGDPFPTGNGEADNMILASKDTYDLFANAFGRDSFDGAGAIMDSIFNRGYSCPNASWNGVFISFCPGLTTDDVTGHEWGHAYTQYTHNLIYQWQPGALNESYSDIFGEVIDRINGRGGDTPDDPRTADACSTHGGTPPPVLTITGGPAAGSYFARASVNEPPRPFTVGPTDMALSTPAGACTAVSGVAGKIAIVDWTLTSTGANECGSGARATNAFNAGATGIIFVAPAAGLLNLGSIAAIASVEVTFADGAIIKAGLPAQATMTLNVGTDDSVRWLMGEDDTAVGLTGPLRDMWNPRCFGNPGKVSDTFEYVCSTSDGGGVHTNSGIPNHGFALAVDGGTYNGQTITGIGLTKASHIYYRAMTVYQGPASDFPDHADALEQSCSDLTGENLPSLTTGAPSGEIISANDCAQLSKAILAVELRTPPTFCNFQPLLKQNPPDRCGPDTTLVNIFRESFETKPKHRWTVGHEAVSPSDFTPRDWTWTGALPGDRSGLALFASNPDIGTCAPGGDESGVQFAISKPIKLASGVTTPLVTFDHWIATEPAWDGGNLKVSVNDGPWQLVASADYMFNPYNATLATVAAGNTNPLAGQAAFSGTDGGSVEGSWGRSHVNLSNYAHPGDTVQLRYDLGNDGCTGRFGWYVDDVRLYTCTQNEPPTISISDVTVTEGDRGKTAAKFTVSLSRAYAHPVVALLATHPGTARFGDFDPGVFLVAIPALSLSTEVSVGVKGDRIPEADETFFVDILLATVPVGDRRGQCTIIDNDVSLTTAATGSSGAQP